MRAKESRGLSAIHRGVYLGPVSRLKWALGLKPWRRCPSGLDHRWRNIYGDEIIQANYYRAACLDCLARSRALIK